MISKDEWRVWALQKQQLLAKSNAEKVALIQVTLVATELLNIDLCSNLILLQENSILRKSMSPVNDKTVVALREANKKVYSLENDIVNSNLALESVQVCFNILGHYLHLLCNFV